MLPDLIPRQYRREAIVQWCVVGFCYMGGLLLTYLGMGFLAALTAKRQYKHPFGESTSAFHSTDYIKLGSVAAMPS